MNQEYKDFLNFYLSMDNPMNMDVDMRTWFISNKILVPILDDLEVIDLELTEYGKLWLDTIGNVEQSTVDPYVKGQHDYERIKAEITQPKTSDPEAAPETTEELTSSIKTMSRNDLEAFAYAMSREQDRLHELLSLIPPCPQHGKLCSAHAMEWIKSQLSEVAPETVAGSENNTSIVLDTVDEATLRLIYDANIAKNDYKSPELIKAVSKLTDYNLIYENLGYLHTTNAGDEWITNHPAPETVAGELDSAYTKVGRNNLYAVSRDGSENSNQIVFTDMNERTVINVTETLNTETASLRATIASMSARIAELEAENAILWESANLIEDLHKFKPDIVETWLADVPQILKALRD